MNQDKLDKIIEMHNKWVNGEFGGKCADLSSADLSGADLSGAIIENIKYNIRTCFLQCDVQKKAF